MLRGDLQNGIAGPAAAASALPPASTHRRCTSQVPLILPLPGAGDIRRSVRFAGVDLLWSRLCITGFSVRLGGICPAARCRGTLVPWRI
jgi:hypothetical protein